MICLTIASYLTELTHYFLFMYDIVSVHFLADVMMYLGLTCYKMCFFFQTDINLDTNEPLNTLSPECLKWCKVNGCSATTVQEALVDQALLTVCVNFDIHKQLYNAC